MIIRVRKVKILRRMGNDNGKNESEVRIDKDRRWR